MDEHDQIDARKRDAGLLHRSAPQPYPSTAALPSSMTPGPHDGRLTPTSAPHLQRCEAEHPRNGRLNPPPLTCDDVRPSTPAMEDCTSMELRESDVVACSSCRCCRRRRPVAFNAAAEEEEEAILLLTVTVM